jgi:hypothetical protein
MVPFHSTMSDLESVHSEQNQFWGTALQNFFNSFQKSKLVCFSRDFLEPSLIFRGKARWIP